MKIRTIIPALVLGVSAVISAKAESVYVLTTLDQIMSFDSAAPGTILTAYTVTGLQTSETLLGLDARPSNGLLYGLGSSSRLYTVNPLTGAATQVGSGQFSTILNGTSFGFDFNPTVDRIRVTSDLDQNLRLNPNTGNIAAVDLTLAYAPADPSFGLNPSINGAAYNNNFAGAVTTTLYGIDSLNNQLVTVNPPNNGTLNTVGLLGIDVSRLNGFDISGVSGLAYAASPASSGDAAANFYIINLATGGATLVGRIGDIEQDFIVKGLTVAVPEPGVTALFALGGGCLLLWKRRRS